MQGDSVCPRCGAAKLKAWEELSRDEKILAERLPASTRYTPEQRKKHRFCTRCWYDKVGDAETA